MSTKTRVAGVNVTPTARAAAACVVRKGLAPLATCAPVADGIDAASGRLRAASGPGHRVSHRRRRELQGLNRFVLRWGMAGIAGASLLGCATLTPWSASSSAKVEPLQRMGHVAQPADEAYAAAKRALGDGQAGVALARFEQALALRPAWPDAENGRVVALARAGRIAEAIAAARAAIRAGAHSPELWANLGQLLVRDDIRADQPSATAAAPVDSAARAKTANSGSDSSATPPLTLQWARTGANVLELQRLAPAPQAIELAISPLPSVSALSIASSGAATKRPNVEVSNGAGRAGLAKGTAQALQSLGVKARLITNHAHFKVQQTEIQYRLPEDAAAARTLARAFALSVELAANPELRPGTDLRVLLGHDAATVMARLNRVTQPQGHEATTRVAQGSGERKR